MAARKAKKKASEGDAARGANGAAASGSKRLVLIDGTNAVYRAFFAIPHLRAPDGAPTNAVYGFVTLLAKLIRESSPDWIAVAWDPRGGSFRKRIDAGYKATRDAQPEDLSSQIPIVREAIEAFEIPFLVVDDFEADDVIATLVRRAPAGTQVDIVSTDKDLLQLVSEHVNLVDPAKYKRVGPAEVEERYGVPPEQMLDVRALIGDPSDNIPGVKGIGEKGAGKLISEWGSLDALLDNAADVKAKRAREALLEHRDAALLSRQLSALRDDVPLDVEFDALRVTGPDVPKLKALYQRLGFTRLLEALDAEAPGPGEASGGGAAAPNTAAASAQIEIEPIHSAQALRDFIASIPADVQLTLSLLYDEGSAVDARPVALGIAREPAHAVVVPFAGDGLALAPGLAEADWVDALGALWPAGAPEAARAWGGADTKMVQSVLRERGVALPAPADDLGIAAFLLDPSGAHQTSALANALLGRECEPWEAVAGRGAKAIAPSAVEDAKRDAWLGTEVATVHALLPLLRERLAKDELTALYDEVELPLTRVLSRMECAGVRVDEAKLADLGEEYAGKIAQAEQEIYALAGEEFLISSPKQLQVILFEKLKLPPLKKTKTGYSTDEGVLEQLSADHEMPAKILTYRRLSKLKSTYIDALPPLISPRTGRIHPRFNQLGAATGRMSASHPNVQNIPIRGEEGARIREAFIPADGRVLMSADYSQVELRILAHYSGDESLITAFENGEDIHRRTAATVWEVAIEDVTDEQRARAKAVNFGIIYGSSAFGLANQLGIAAGEAQETIDAYFARYQGVRRFIDETMEHAKTQGYVVTLGGRRRYLPDLNSRNRVLRQAAERMAVNTVIQGTAADLIKRAMGTLDAELEASGLAVTLMLQVHDELVFEVTEADRPALEDCVRARMEGAMTLAVPLVVDCGHGANWRAAH